MNRAADLITSLLAQIAALRFQLSEVQERASEWAILTAEWQLKYDALRAERDEHRRTNCERKAP